MPKGKNKVPSDPRPKNLSFRLDVDSDNPINIIHLFRAQIGERDWGDQAELGGKYLLPPKPMDLNNSSTIDLQLGYKNDPSVYATVRLRMHDLYAGGFKNMEGKWFQLGKGIMPAMPEPKELINLGDGYPGLKTKSGWTNLTSALKRRNRKRLYDDALHTLSKFEKNRTELQSVAQALLSIILCFCESARLNSILEARHSDIALEYGYATLEKGSEEIDWVQGLVRNWSNLSEVVVDMYRNGIIEELNATTANYDLCVPKYSNRGEEFKTLATAKDALEELGLINRGNWKKEGPSRKYKK